MRDQPPNAEDLPPAVPSRDPAGRQAAVRLAVLVDPSRSLWRDCDSKAEDSDSFQPTIYCTGRYVLEFATCPFDRGTLPAAKSRRP
jgi:hypothetical protein